MTAAAAAREAWRPQGRRERPWGGTGDTSRVSTTGAGTMRGRHRATGANTPWERIRWMRGDAALPRSRWHSNLTEARDGLGELSPELAVDGVQRVWAVQGDGDDLIVLAVQDSCIHR